MKKSTSKKELKTLGQRIRSIRGDLTQVELAQALRIKPAMVSRYEADKETPSPKTMLAIARFSGRSMEWILTGEEQKGSERTKPLLKGDLVKSIGQDLLNIQDDAAKDFVQMMNDLFQNQQRMKKVLDFHRYLKIEEK